jgi:hypothetical protein
MYYYRLQINLVFLKKITAKTEKQNEFQYLYSAFPLQLYCCFIITSEGNY